MIEFTDPPPAPSNRAGKPRLDWHAVAEELKSRPGEWALVLPSGFRSDATAIKNGQRVAFRPAGAFESVTRVAKATARYAVYVRYVGERDVS